MPPRQPYRIKDNAPPKSSFMCIGVSSAVIDTHLARHIQGNAAWKRAYTLKCGGRQTDVGCHNVRWLCVGMFAPCVGESFPMSQAPSVVLHGARMCAPQICPAVEFA